jgi:isocitrate dehydrogenase kinase/phosphatase
MNSNMTLRPVRAAVASIQAAYATYERGFEEITRRARGRFERRDWSGAQADATERLALYKAHVDAAVADVHDILEDAVMERTVWAAMRTEHASHMRGQPDVELAETFFNSVTRRVFSTVGVDPAIEYLDRVAPAKPAGNTEDIARTYEVASVDPQFVRQLLLELTWAVPYAELERDTVLVADLMDARIRAAWECLAQ